MAYVTGIVNSFADLITAIQTACTDNGYTLAGSVLHKGTLYASVAAYTATLAGATATGISLGCGNGIDGSDALTDPAPLVRLATLVASANTVEVWAWPVTYHIHVLTAPDEVYVEVNYNGAFWQRLCFGQSPSPGNAGSGNWLHGTAQNPLYYPYLPNKLAISDRGVHLGSTVCTLNAAPFFLDWLNPNSWVNQASYMHGAIDTSSDPQWSGGQAFAAVSPYLGVTAGVASYPLYGYTPNTWNDQAVLFPVQVMQARQSAKVSMIGELGHMRYVRNDYYEDGEIITLGADRWKVYPMFRKNAADPAGTTQDDAPAYPDWHSGTMAVAIRYDGP